MLLWKSLLLRRCKVHRFKICQFFSFKHGGMYKIWDKNKRAIMVSKHFNFWLQLATCLLKPQNAWYMKPKRRDKSAKWQKKLRPFSSTIMIVSVVNYGLFLTSQTSQFKDGKCYHWLLSNNIMISFQKSYHWKQQIGETGKNRSGLLEWWQPCQTVLALTLNASQRERR